MTIQTGGTNDIQHGFIFLETMSELGTRQHCQKVTCPVSQKILNLMSDQNVVITTLKLVVTRSKIPQRKIYKCDQADWDEVKEGTKELVTR